VRFPLDRPYVFDGARYELRVLASGAPAPDRGVAVHAPRLGILLFDERNTGERERLLRDLGLPHLRPRSLDLADRSRHEAELYRTLERRFDLYEVPRPKAVARSSPLEWFPAAKASPDLSWIGVWLVDQSGQPVAGRPYRVIAPDGQTTAGTLDDQGSANVKRLPPGSCQVFCPDVEPHASLTYTVARGDHISGIAMAFGFDDYMLVWSRPENAALRSQRSREHELVEGDQVFIPPLTGSPVNKPTGADHVFVLRLSPLKLRIKLLGVAMKPLASAACELDGSSLSTDGDGILEVTLDKSSQSKTLTLGDDDDVVLLPGALTPNDTDSDDGWIGRLYNLGFLFDADAQEGDVELGLALEDFQAEAGLPVTGEIDDATKAALLQMHAD
jgi:hypothetical protein